MSQIYTAPEIIPSPEEVKKILECKLAFESAQTKPDRDAWNKQNFTKTPWGISYTLSKARHEKTIAMAKNRGWDKQNGYKPPVPKSDIALKYFIIAVALDWQDLIKELKRTLVNWGYTTADLKQFAADVWQDPVNAQAIANMCEISYKVLTEQVSSYVGTALTEAVEKHDTLNTKLFTKEEVLKDRVRSKLLEIVDEFLADLKEQDIEIKVEDILLIGSNASYNYTKDSDIDLHILTNTKAVKYSAEVSNALYSAYRSLFNKQLDITIFDIPLELFVETEESARVSNGIYSVKKNKWLKRPEHKAIPEYDKEALNTLSSKWETKCKALIDDIKADKLKDEKKVLKMIEDIYDKLRKKGISKGEYSIENLAFKELRNEGYLDKLKNYRNELTSKRLSLEERLDRQTRINIFNEITHIVGTQPVIQDNGVFYIYNIKASDVSSKINALRKLPYIAEVQANETSKYDFSNTLEIAMNHIPSKYYNIRGTINY